MKNSITEKLLTINRTGWRLITEEDNLSIIRNFAMESIKVLSADFGFAWGKSPKSEDHILVYKTPKMPFAPIIPIIRKNKLIKKENLLFDSKIKKENYEKGINSHFKSYIIIPIS